MQNDYKIVVELINSAIKSNFYFKLKILDTSKSIL